MEWVETTGKTVAEAQERALDQLGVARDEAEFEVIDEPKSGLFGLMRGEARVRGRVRPTAVRPKNDRRRGRGKSGDKRSNTNEIPPASSATPTPTTQKSVSRPAEKPARQRDDEAREESSVSPQEVGEAAVTFMNGLVTAFGVSGTSTLAVDGHELDVAVDGSDLGLLVGPGGRTLNAVQDLARVAAQRRLGDHETRLRIDVAGYREKRRAALEAFTRKVAAEVVDSGAAKALEPMSSVDRKVVHDTVTNIEGVESRSDGDDPGRRVVIMPS